MMDKHIIYSAFCLNLTQKIYFFVLLLKILWQKTVKTYEFTLFFCHFNTIFLSPPANYNLWEVILLNNHLYKTLQCIDILLRLTITPLCQIHIWHHLEDLCSHSNTNRYDFHPKKTDSKVP